MPTSFVYYKGGPCDNDLGEIKYDENLPKTTVCKGTTYHLFPEYGSTTPVYATQAWIDGFNAKNHVHGQRDVFRAWHRLHHVMGHRTRGERNRIVGARHRIKRAVR